MRKIPEDSYYHAPTCVCHRFTVHSTVFPCVRFTAWRARPQLRPRDFRHSIQLVSKSVSLLGCNVDLRKNKFVVWLGCGFARKAVEDRVSHCPRRWLCDCFSEQSALSDAWSRIQIDDMKWWHQAWWAIALRCIRWSAKPHITSPCRTCHNKPPLWQRTPALNRRREPIMLHEFSISEENLPGAGKPWAACLYFFVCLLTLVELVELSLLICLCRWLQYYIMDYCI